MVYVRKPAATAPAAPAPAARPARQTRNPRLRPGTHEFALRVTVTVPPGALGTVEELLQSVTARINGKTARLLGQWFQIQVASLNLTAVSPPAPRTEVTTDGTV